MLVCVCPTMLATYAPPILSIKHAVLPRSVGSLDILSQSSHCSQVLLHSRVTPSFPSLFRVHPSVALYFVSTVLLVLLFVLSSWSAALLLSESLVLVRFSFTTCFSSSRPPRACSPISARFFCRCLGLPAVSLRFPSSCEGLRISSPGIHIIHPLPCHFIVKFTHFHIVRTPLMPPSP